MAHCFAAIRPTTLLCGSLPEITTSGLPLAVPHLGGVTQDVSNVVRVIKASSFMVAVGFMVAMSLKRGGSSQAKYDVDLASIGFSCPQNSVKSKRRFCAGRGREKIATFQIPRTYPKRASIGAAWRTAGHGPLQVLSLHALSPRHFVL